MTEGKLLTVREVSHVLGISEKEVLDLADQGSIPAYNVGGVYLRFRLEQVEEFKKKNQHLLQQNRKEYTLRDRLSDFFYFYDFYILAFVLIAILLYIILYR